MLLRKTALTLTGSIESTITNFFEAVDHRNWTAVALSMDTRLWIDYASMSGQPPAWLPATEVITVWQNFLPGFDSTHHQIEDILANQTGGAATASFTGRADHFLNGECWTVRGRYTATLSQKDTGWKLTSLTFLLQEQSGNTHLPSVVIEKMQAGEKAVRHPGT